MAAATQQLRDKWTRFFNSKEGSDLKFIDAKTVFCQACESSFTAVQKSQIKQHVETSRHDSNRRLKLKRKHHQAQLEDDLTTSSKRAKCFTFNCELSEALLAANIPWRKLEVTKFRDFLEEKMSLTIPDESTLRKNYLEPCYQNVMEAIRNDLKDSTIWIGADETTDAEGRCVLNIIAGKLCSEYCQPHLIDCVFLEKSDSAIVSRAVNETVTNILFPSFHRDLLMLFVSDAATYMIKCGTYLKVFFPRLQHVTCLAHAIHRVCEYVRETFKDVNELIAVGKKLFRKAPARVRQWKQTNSEIPLPPQPVLTRWGTWITAALYYAQHLEAVKTVVENFEQEEAACINSALELLRRSSIKSDLTFIASHLSFLPETIENMETAGLTLKQSLDLLEHAKVKLFEIPGKRGALLQTKFNAVLSRNPDFKHLQAMCKVMEGEEDESVPDGYSPSDIAHFKYAPVTNVEVERSFSIYKTVLSDRRRSFTEENLRKVMVTHCYYNSNE